jgi:hypothetical protein
MKLRHSNKKYFTDEGHLDDNNIALYVDALILDKIETLPTSVLEHVEDCMECKTSIMGLYGIVKNQEEIKNLKHPYLHRPIWSSQRQWLKMAAIFLGLITFSWTIFYLLDSQKDYQQLFAQNFEPYDDVITERGAISSDYDTIFFSILTNYYNKGDFENANLLFDKLYNLSKAGDSLLFYYGVSSLASGESSQAIHLFKEMDRFKKSIFFTQSRWYLALAYLSAAIDSEEESRQDMVANSKNILQEIIDSKSDYTEKAAVLLSELSK